MADLRALLEEIGYTDVRTVLASGNAVITGQAKSREKLEKALADRFGMQIDVILRTMKELHAVVDADPFGDEVTNPTRYFVVFLDAAPNAAKLDPLLEERLLAGQARRERPRALRLVPGRHAEQPPDEGAGQAGPGGHRHRPQLGDRQQALGVVRGGNDVVHAHRPPTQAGQGGGVPRGVGAAPWHERMVRAYHLRSEDDPTQVITLGFFEGTEEELDAMRDTPEWMSGEERRLRRIAPLEESILLSGVWDVVEEIQPARAPRATPPERSRAGPAGAGRPRPGPRAPRRSRWSSFSGPASRESSACSDGRKPDGCRGVDRRRAEAAASRLDVETARRAPGRARDRQRAGARCRCCWSRGGPPPRARGSAPRGPRPTARASAGRAVARRRDRDSGDAPPGVRCSSGRATSANVAPACSARETWTRSSVSSSARSCGQRAQRGGRLGRGQRPLEQRQDALGVRGHTLDNAA